VALAGQDARVIAAADLLELGLAARPRGTGET
jgi:hypothetical protein